MRVTVALCTHNPKSEPFRRVLESVIPQLSRLDGSEFFVIDNNSSPPLRELPWLSGLPLQVVEEPIPGLTAAREAAFRASGGDIIVFVDDDTVLSDAYIERVLEAFEEHERLGVFGGAVFPEYAVTPPEWFSDFEPWLAVRRYPPEHRSVTSKFDTTAAFPIGAGLAIRRSVALDYLADAKQYGTIQGRTGATLSSGEDLDLCLFALASGYTLRTTGAVSVVHIIASDRLEPEYLARLGAGSVGSAAALEAKWKARLGNSLYPMLGANRGKLRAQKIMATLLALKLPKYRIKRAVYSALLQTQITTRG